MDFAIWKRALLGERVPGTENEEVSSLAWKGAGEDRGVGNNGIGEQRGGGVLIGDVSFAVGDAVWFDYLEWLFVVAIGRVSSGAVVVSNGRLWNGRWFALSLDVGHKVQELTSTIIEVAYSEEQEKKPLTSVSSLSTRFGV